MKKKVLIMAGFYVPSVKGGGPIQSIKNLVENLSDEIDFYIVAADRDLGDDKPFDNIVIDEWVKVGKANVYYTDTAKLSWSKISRIINKSQSRILYLNSFFGYKSSIVPILLKKMNRLTVDKIIIAPRGQFSPGAVGLKRYKKKLFILISKIFNLYRNVIWHATADMEKEHIKSFYGDRIKLEVANNLTANYSQLEYVKSINKTTGELKVVFISRIHPKKNLKQAINYLYGIKGDVIFNIYGPIEDEVYWQECKKIISTLPSSINVNYKGVVSHDEIMNVFKNHHIFLFPTLGENFGHVITEALIGGCPVIISDQTPWRNLFKNGVGWDINLNSDMEFEAAIQSCVSMDNRKYQEVSKNAFDYARKMSNQQDVINETNKLFC